jgi:hypothetical protein
MTKTIEALEGIIPKYSKLLRAISVTEIETKPSPGKWSKKEQVGHLIDSAQNNIRRFLEAQYQSQPPTIVYNQDEWVALNNYQSWPADELISLWELLNKQVVFILKSMPADKYNNICNRRDPHTILWLAQDYNKHLLYHLHRILDLEPLQYP